MMNAEKSFTKGGGYACSITVCAMLFLNNGGKKSGISSAMEGTEDDLLWD